LRILDFAQKAFFVMFVNYYRAKMKILFKSAIVVMALATLLTYSGCDPGGPGDPTVEEVQLAKLSGSWAVSASQASTDVKLNAVSQKTDYNSFTLTLTGTPGATSFGYTTTGRPAKLNPWPSSGTWKFSTNSPETTVIRDPGGADELEMTYTVSDTQLEITFTFAGAGYSRTKQVQGTWVFTMVKN
jgi:hypothetical protein